MKTLKNKIFVQIAAYRDPELLPTIQNCIDMAENPDNLHFCIAWQHSDADTWDTLAQYVDDPRFTIIDIPYNHTKGTCWARNLIQQYWNGEEYTLHLDSHHRFVKDWDTVLIKMMKDLKKAGHKKPLLTAYVPSYEPKNDPASRASEPWWMTFDRFTPEGAVFFIPQIVPDWKSRTLPLPARFLSAHFLFTLGKFCKEVPHDPNYLFHGEEISLAARAYTWGYDLFAPHKVVVWHEYTRSHRPRKSWDDIPQWTTWDVESLARNRRLLNIDNEHDSNEDFGVSGFGSVRTLQEYEDYAGISFVNRGVRKQVLDHVPPPTGEGPYIRVFKHCIDIPFIKVPHDDYNVWAVAFEDQDGNELIRVDAYTDEILRMKSDPDGYCKLWRTFHTEKQPKKWVVWPHSEKNGWCERLTGEL
jgi:hypothetical protein